MTIKRTEWLLRECSGKIDVTHGGSWRVPKITKDWDTHSPFVLAIVIVTLALTSPLFAIDMCPQNGSRHTCIVDGDTIWLNGVNYRLDGFDTPEPYTNICGGHTEVALAHRASARLLELLNSNEWQLWTTGQLDRYGRGLATITVNGRDVGDILIAEGLARSWPDGGEFWCH
ncbi:hypothetical protein GTA62_19640 [Roseobacter sp. HKCCD9010]|uniref:thermonuclease family protein n=1 Tax=unclassified Roseobacter TaxID=196798 RepID=UPI001492331D|nr:MULTISPECIES: thermonuclease family protein [unclassified Roseobacter]MBF9052177.1 hypothetical protein [Rhodobacterales bacterium HKCCD4356]NNV14132.1 hypothetical protein [Roseobacter sp. HKCCD7357]NNV18356.1 hypothetical protein [Roseobacter sp. HKCCD8768]NNV27796.1 hypothetical protein [Roseobacter sp. HKCCD8192]NNV32100.1 hypothetical protein [Roseobacter sp. HKCCD9061]NNV36508.1 hypothetical protein [Roseobacter sp. HKCCD9073]NNV40583.1 hypothetical protein [Roseobacter sp. HKCCD905